MLKTECFFLSWSKRLEEYDLEVKLEDATPQISLLNFVINSTKGWRK